MGILGFQNRVTDIKLSKFHANRDNRAYLKKYDFSVKTRLPYLRPSLDSWRQNDSGNGLES